MTVIQLITQMFAIFGLILCKRETHDTKKDVANSSENMVHSNILKLYMHQ